MTRTSIPNATSFPPIYGENIEREYPNVRLSIERITPDIAKKMLETNVGNRDLKREPLAQALENGEWQLGNDAITFDENGNLTNGQNRLNACINANMPIDVIVARGIKRSAQVTMDTGVKRSLVDYLKMKGYKNCSTVGAIGTALQYVEKYGMDGAFGRQGSNLFTLKSTLDFIDEHDEKRIEPIVRDVMLFRSKQGSRVINSRTLGALFDTFRQAGDDNYRSFVDQLTNKKTACASVRLLLNRLSEYAEEINKGGTLVNQKYVAAIIIKAWNAYMRGDDIKQLRFRQGGAHPESFPEIILTCD